MGELEFKAFILSKAASGQTNFIASEGKADFSRSFQKNADPEHFQQILHLFSNLISEEIQLSSELKKFVPFASEIFQCLNSGSRKEISPKSLSDLYGSDTSLAF